MDDHLLLREYVEHQSGRAFAELVERHLPLVYATALRLVHDPAAAEDVAQTVFIQLARKAWRVRPGALTGWLYNAAKCASVDYLRREGRRRHRETEAVKLAEQTTDPAVSWEQLAPLVDDALSQLNPVEQSAILLRFFDGQSMSETGRLLSLSEPAAQKRVSRALEKMRAHFARQGVTASAALLATTLGTQAATPPPAGLAGKITGPSVAGAIGKTGGTGVNYLLARILFMSTRTKTMLTVAMVIVLIALSIAGLWWYTQPVTTSEKVAFAPTNPKSHIDPKSPALHPPPSAPLMPPPPKASQSPQAPSPAVLATDPQANLNTALADIARLERAGDMVAKMKTYTPPDDLANDPQMLQQIQEDQAEQAEIVARYPQSQAALQQRTQQMHEGWARSYEDLKDQPPTFNATGDEATYILTLPTVPGWGGLPDYAGHTMPLIMVKINGKWYLKQSSDGPSPDVPDVLGTSRTWVTLSPRT